MKLLRLRLIPPISTDPEEPVTPTEPQEQTVTSNAQMSDGERAAQISIQLTQEGRLELAEAVLRLAIQAHKAESTPPRIVNVPFAGATREEPPANGRRPYPVGDRGPEEVIPAATYVSAALSDGASTAVMDAGQTARCAVKIRKGEHLLPCDAGIFWQHGAVGDENTVARLAGWYHVDGTWDDHHEARHE